MYTKLKKIGGFTLLEILIALFVFTIISVIITSALHTVLNSQTRTEQSAARLSHLQMALLIMSRDLEQTIERPITNNLNQQEAALLGKANALTLTHAGLGNPLGQVQRSTLQRTRYRIENETLIREAWPVLDQVSNTKPSQRELLHSVTQLRFQYLDKDNHFLDQWPPEGNQSTSGLPRAIQVTLILKNWGKISQIYIIPGSNLDNSK